MKPDELERLLDAGHKPAFDFPEDEFDCEPDPQADDKRRRLTSAKATRIFALAGNATLTLVSTKTKTSAHRIQNEHRRVLIAAHAAWLERVA
jgi:hypothetical protein